MNKKKIYLTIYILSYQVNGLQHIYHGLQDGLQNGLHKFQRFTGKRMQTQAFMQSMLIFALSMCISMCLFTFTITQKHVWVHAPTAYLNQCGRQPAE